eukprot:TRINITY_DN2217_c0_g1_i2.p1 TRINITY_DN2217_c0_g1~~TRINITY_DN2217_c0_g1_i2.p1  ORF type:complete len:356 (-),score=71.04 TRINITY_DN2217_c0_g1_i2:169-1236(-)
MCIRDRNPPDNLAKKDRPPSGRGNSVGTARTAASRGQQYEEPNYVNQAQPPTRMPPRPPVSNVARNRAPAVSTNQDYDELGNYEAGNSQPSTRRGKVQAPVQKETSYTPSAMQNAQKRAVGRAAPQQQAAPSRFVKEYSSPEDDRPAVASRKPVLPEDDYDGDDLQLRECPEGCGRSFNLKSLQKHVKVCRKVFQTKRKAFDVAAQRKTEEQAKLEAENRRPMRKGAPQKQTNVKQPSEMPVGGAKKKPKWKIQSEAFRAGIRGNHGGGNRGGGSSLPVQDGGYEQDDFVKCDHCGRRFNENAAQRHIPFCANKAKLDKFKNGPPGNAGGYNQKGYGAGSSGMGAGGRGSLGGRR